MKDREFGVELEFDSNGLGNSGVGDLLWENGFREEWIGTKNHRYGENTYSKIGWDGSEFEIKTPILKGTKGFNDLKTVVNLLGEEGCYTTEEDGLHVHHNAPEFIGNKPLIVKLLRSWKNNEQHIAEFIDQDRVSWSMDYDGPCPSFSNATVDEYESSNRVLFGSWERFNLNVNALTKHGSVEFRFHEGSLIWDEIESWIRFGQYFLNGVVARKNPIAPVDSPVVLMNRLKTNKKTKVMLARKAGLSLEQQMVLA